MLKQKKTKFTLVLIFTLLTLLIQNSQEERDKTNHNKENKALLKKAIDMHKLLNELKKERKQDKEKYKESQKAMIRKLQRWYVPMTTDRSQRKTIEPSSSEGSRKKIKKMSLYGIKNIQTQSVRQLKSLPSPQKKPILLSNPISLRSRTNNFTLKLPKISETRSLNKPPLSSEYKSLVIKKNDLLYKLTNLQKEIEEAIEKYSYAHQNGLLNRMYLSRELRGIIKPLRSFDEKLVFLISEITEAEYSELSYEKLREFSQRTQDLENYYRTNIRELMSKISEKVKKIDNLIFRAINLEGLLPLVAIGDEPYSYLSLKERKTLYQNLCHEYEEIINELGPEPNMMYLFRFYKAFPKFVPQKTQHIKQEQQEQKETNQEQVTLLISKLKELAPLSILNSKFDSVVSGLTNIKTLIESNLKSEPEIFRSTAEKENCKDWQEKLEQDPGWGEWWKNLVIVGANGEINLKEDFVFLSSKETLSKIIEEIGVCIDPVLPRKIKKLFNNLGCSTYKEFSDHINSTANSLLEDIEKIKAISQYISVCIRDLGRVVARNRRSLGLSDKEIIEQVISSFGLDIGQIECIVKDITIAQQTNVRDVTADTIEQAFKKCDIKEDQKEKMIEYAIGKKIDEKIGLRNLSLLTKSSDEIVRLYVELFNSCSQIYSEDIPKIIKFKYDVFTKTFNLLWGKLKDKLLSEKDYYEKNKEAWKTKYICIIRLHQHASTILHYASKLNRGLLIKLCSDEIEAMNIEKKKQKNLQDKFSEYIYHDPPQACQVIKIYQKGIEIDRIDEINNRIADISDRCFFDRGY